LFIEWAKGGGETWQYRMTEDGLTLGAPGQKPFYFSRYQSPERR
jgi:hypothetical protein